MKHKIINERNVIKELKNIGADPMGIEIMKHKAVFRIIKLYGIKPALANIIKEDMLSAGGEAAVHKLSCACKVEKTDIILMGTLAQYKHLLSDLSYQPYGGRDVYSNIKKLLKIKKNRD
jgi:dihydropteroate synthase